MFEINDLRDIMQQYQKEICYYNQMQVYATTKYEQSYYEGLIQERTDDLVKLLEKNMVQTDQENSGVDQEAEPILELTLEELATFNGKSGNPAYVAMNGIIYDVSTAPAWRGGNHLAGITAGKDLTRQFQSCHQGNIEVLERYPRVGVLVDSI